MVKYQDIKEKAVDTAKSAKKNILKARGKTEDYVKEHPFTSIAIAAGIGAVVAIGVNALIKPKRKSFLDKLRERY